MHTTIIVHFTLCTLIGKPCSTKAIPSITLSMSNRSSIKIMDKTPKVLKHYCLYISITVNIIIVVNTIIVSIGYHQSYASYTKLKTRILEAVKWIKTQDVKKKKIKNNWFNILQYLHTLTRAELIRWIISSSGHRGTLTWQDNLT